MSLSWKEVDVKEEEEKEEEEGSSVDFTVKMHQGSLCQVWSNLWWLLVLESVFGVMASLEKPS